MQDTMQTLKASWKSAWKSDTADSRTGHNSGKEKEYLKWERGKNNKKNNNKIKWEQGSVHLKGKATLILCLHVLQNTTSKKKGTRQRGNRQIHHEKWIPTSLSEQW